MVNLSDTKISDTSITVACCQLSLAVGDPDANRSKIRNAIREAEAAGARVVVLPELANTGYMFADAEALSAAAEPVDGPTVTEWIDLARELTLIIAAGFAERGD